MNQAIRYASALLTVALVACDGDATAPATRPTFAGEASRLTTDEGPRFSDWSTPVNLGAVVNTIGTNSDPFISKDGLTLYFATGVVRPGFGGRDIWVSHRASVDAPWEEPQNLGPVINTASHEQKPTLSVDGHRLYFVSDRPGGLGGFDYYVSRRHDKRDDFGWEAPVNLGSPLNSSASEQFALTMFEDEATGNVIVYFASARPGLGGNDIYTSTLLADGTFSPATIVAELSSRSNDQDPAIRKDGLELFLASDRPGTQGALDLWVATRASTSDPWSAPVSLGSLINTPTRPPGVEQANDMCPSLSFDGTTLFWCSAFREGNLDFMFDIWSATRTKLHGSPSEQ